MPTLLTVLALGTALASPLDPPADDGPETEQPAETTVEPSAEPAESPTAEPQADEPPPEPALETEPAPTEQEESALAGLTQPAARHARVLLDDRAETAQRVEAAADLGALGDPELIWLLRAAARDRIPELQEATIRAAATLGGPQAVSAMAWIVADKPSTFEPRQLALNAIIDDISPEAGEALYALASDRHVPSSLRSQARRALESQYSELLERRGTPRPVTDIIGGTAFVLAWGTTGGVSLSSVGEWGAFDGGPAIGGIGGSAIGVGGGTLFATRVPLTTGQGLAQASGTAWGLTTALWTSTAIHGRSNLLYREEWSREDDTRRERRLDLDAGYRLAGVGVGAALGAVWLTQEPRAWDVLEVDLATYLGSAIALSATGLATWKGEDWRQTWGEDNYAALTEQRWKTARLLDASNVAGAAAGMAVGFAIKDKWELDAPDAAFAMTIGLEAAWVGNFAPDALGLPDENAKGTVRLPWNAAIAAGLAIAELHPMPYQTTAVTGVAGAAGNAIGAGIPMALGADDQAIFQVMLPVGIATTTAGVFAAPWFDPGAGEWTMTGVTTGLGGYNLYAMGSSAKMTPDGSTGVSLIGAGAGALGALTAGHWADPRADHMITLASSAAWGSFYGGLAPIALGDTLASHHRPLAAAIGTDIFVAGTAIALSKPVGLRPRQTIVPQLLGLTGATLGALGTGIATQNERAVAGGALIGATVGLGGGAVVAALQKSPAKTTAMHLPLLPGEWTPVISPTTVEGEPAVYLGIRGAGW